jgi:hypothetical protein
VEFAKMGPKVLTIDATWEHLNKEMGPYPDQALKELGVLALMGDSAESLRTMIVFSDEPHLFYLDSHGGSQTGDTWWNVNPIKEELKTIGTTRECIDKCVIVIHDFQVPGKPWGYNGGDWGKGWEHLNIDLIQPFLTNIYPKDYHYHYNEEAEGMQRGVIYIYPKE